MLEKLLNQPWIITALVAMICILVVIFDRVCVYLSARRSGKIWNTAVERCKERDEKRAARLIEAAKEAESRGDVSQANKLRELAEFLQRQWVTSYREN